MKKNSFKKFFDFTTAGLRYRGLKAAQVKKDNQLNHFELAITAPVRALVYPALGFIALVGFCGAGITVMLISPFALLAGIKNFMKLFGLGMTMTAVGAVSFVINLIAGPCTLIAMPYNGYIAYKHKYKRKLSSEGQQHNISLASESEDLNSYQATLNLILESPTKDKNTSKKLVNIQKSSHKIFLPLNDAIVGAFFKSSKPKSLQTNKNDSGCSSCNAQSIGANDKLHFLM